MTDQKKTAALLRIIATTIEGLSDQQYKNLLTGQATMECCEESKSSKQTQTPKEKIPVPVSSLVNELHRRFLELTTEEEAYTLLSATPKVTKDVLHELAGLLNVHVPKKTPKDQYMKAIIDSTIGSRLRTEAFKRVDLGSGRK